MFNDIDRPLSETPANSTIYKEVAEEPDSNRSQNLNERRALAGASIYQGCYIMSAASTDFASVWEATRGIVATFASRSCGVDGLLRAS